MDKCNTLFHAVVPDTQETVHVNQEDMVGIVMLVTKEMDVVTVTDNIYNVLGINSVDILGNNILDILHPCDHSVLQAVFSGGDDKHQVVVRMKNLLGDNGRVFTLRQAGYKVSIRIQTE